MKRENGQMVYGAAFDYACIFYLSHGGGWENNIDALIGWISTYGYSIMTREI